MRPETMLSADMEREAIRAFLSHPLNRKLNELLLESFARDARRQSKRLSNRRRRGGGKRGAACAR